MDILIAFDGLRNALNSINIWQTVTVLVLVYEFIKIALCKVKAVNSFGFNLLEKYRTRMNRREHNQKNIEAIDELRIEIKKYNDKINAISTMIIELKEIIEKNEERNSEEHMEMENRRNEARRETLKQELYAAYYKYRDRAEREGKRELSPVEYEGFWSMFHEYESEPLNGDGQVHSVVEVYMRGFVESPDRE